MPVEREDCSVDDGEVSEDGNLELVSDEEDFDLDEGDEFQRMVYSDSGSSYRPLPESDRSD